MMFKSMRAFICSLSFFASLSMLASTAYALTPTSEYQLKLLTQGGPASIKSTSESIYRTGAAEQEVTDTLAEVLLQNYASAGDGDYVDALSWAAKALGSTRNARYRNTLTEVLEKGTNKKLNKYVSASLKSIPEADTEQYVKGTIDLNAARAQNADTKAAPAATAQSGTSKITAAMPGMSMEEVTAVCGAPTSTTSHMTGKAFIPFNFKGKGDVVMIALYKGQGKIIYTHPSRYTSTWQVEEVTLNPNETGYP
ncbi:MAG: hypothetical protein V4732_04185 [Pseudomonadota bacterium]